METPNLKPCCPDCRSTNIKLVAFYLVSPQGTDLNAKVKYEDYTRARETVLCQECNHKCPLVDAQKAGGLDSVNAMVVTNDRGVEVPIVCNYCGNKKFFTKESLQLQKVVSHIENKPEGVVEERGADPQLREEVVLRYHCAVEGCTGCITINSENYVLEKE